MAMALALIKEYRQEFNREVRAKRVSKVILSDSKYIDKMRTKGFNCYIRNDLPSYRYREASRNFFTFTEASRKNVFVSKGLKNSFIRSLSWALGRAVDRRDVYEADKVDASILSRQNDYVKHLTEEIEHERMKPVEAELGKTWRTYVKAVHEEKLAHEKKYAIRSAIKVFNKLNTGISIHFGNCRSSAMNRIYRVCVNGEDIPVSKFIENAEFETAVLAA
jgi:hypothetical protein